MRVRAAVVALAFAAASAAPAFAAPMTVKGEIIDQACYTKDKANKGRFAQGLRADLRQEGRARWRW